MATSAENPLGTFLKARRARLDPAACGLRAAPRRTPGLRREEVAQRADISAKWYTFLEQGRGGAPSMDVLNRLSTALELTGAEREHLFHLVQPRAGAHRGDLSDLGSLAAGAQACDGVIHTAFGHDFSKYLEAGETDRRAVEAMARALEGSNKPLVITSGTTIVTPGQTATEDQPARTDSPSGVRAPSEHALAAASERGVRGVALRLPPSVHGEGDHGFVPALVAVARKTGVSAYVGDGANRWPAVHRLDAARLFRLALETGAAGALHGAAEAGIPMRDIAATIGEGLGIPVRSISADEANSHFDWMAMFVGIDNPTSSATTRDAVGWHPREAGLLADMRGSGYFS